MPNARKIADRLDALLRTADIPDYTTALNGLQLASRGEVRRVATAVDFSSHIVRETVRTGAQMLLVHHGMFWGGLQPLTGLNYERLAALIASDTAVYSSHLPLDVHPDLGNNALLARRCGLRPTSGFARYKTIDVGLSGESDVTTTSLVEHARQIARESGGDVVVTPFAPDRRTRRWAICTGAGADSETIREAVERGIDTMIVGEGPHHTAVQARDLGIVVMYAGHYATETLGIRALGERVAQEFGVEAQFLDAPTGL
jgi:dinuclear metal center YbgI/SA1388 family protein